MPITRLQTEERGIAMLMALALITLITIISVTLFTVTTGDKARSDTSAKQNAAYQAAEAGTNAYLSDLTESTAFPNAYLAKGEATRTDTSGVKHASSSTSDVAWSSGSTWTYATAMASDTGWYDLGNGYQYLIKVYPANPSLSQSQAQVITRIDVTGRPTGSTDTSAWRTVETMIRPLSLADFLSFSATSVHYLNTATTTGPIFVGEDSAGHPGTLTHDGTAKASLYSEGTVTGANTQTLLNGARKYDKNTTPTALCKINACNPIPFSTFQSSVTAVSTAAGSGGIKLGTTDSQNPDLSSQGGSVDVWSLTFNSNGTVTVASCLFATYRDSHGTTHDYADYTGTAPDCNGHVQSPQTVPANGAIYSPVDVIITGTVKGKVTVATSGDAIFSGNTTYNQNGTDVLGVEAQGWIYVSSWGRPTSSVRNSADPQQTIWAAMLALGGAFSSDPNYSNSNNNGTLNTEGSIDVYGDDANDSAIEMSNQYRYRNYNYDANLLFVQPPLWPTLPASFTILVQREI